MTAVCPIFKGKQRMSSTLWSTFYSHLTTVYGIKRRRESGESKREKKELDSQVERGRQRERAIRRVKVEFEVRQSEILYAFKGELSNINSTKLIGG